MDDDIICGACGMPIALCECDSADFCDEPIEFGDNIWIWGYDGDCE